MLRHRLDPGGEEEEGEGEGPPGLEEHHREQGLADVQVDPEERDRAAELRKAIGSFQPEQGGAVVVNDAELRVEHRLPHEGRGHDRGDVGDEHAGAHQPAAPEGLAQGERGDQPSPMAQAVPPIE